MDTPVYFSNPEDGVATYDLAEIHRSDNYVTILATVSLDLTTRTQFGPGYTLYVDLTGSSSYSYKVRFKSSVGGNVSEYSPIIATGSSYAITGAKAALKDTVAASQVFTDAEYQAIEKRSVGKLFPRLMVLDEDTSQTIAENTIDYDLPVNCFRVTQVFRGSIANNNWEEIEKFEMVSGKTLRLDENDVGQVSPLTIYYRRRFRNSGEVPATLQPIVIHDMLAELYDALSSDRGVKFKAFQALQRDSDIRPETLKQMAGLERQEADRLKAEIERG